MRVIAALAMSIAASLAHAEPIACAGWSNLEPDTRISISTVKVPKANFVKDGAQQVGCPSASANCERKGFVVSGDMLIVSGQHNGFACAQYVNANGLETTGFVSLAALTEVPMPPMISSADWVGNWHGNPEQTIRITPVAGAGMVNVRGDATFGALDPRRVKRGAVNVGEFDAKLTLVGETASFAIGDEGNAITYEKGDEYSCRIRMRRLGPFLMVEDNHQCGGNNVSFTGDYRHK